MALLLTAGVERTDAASQGAFERVAQTKHVRCYSTRGLKVDAQRTEEFLERLFSLFGPMPRGWRLEYYRHPSVAELETRIGFAAYGVTDVEAGRIDSVRDYHPHELVHVVAGRLGQPPILFTEGLAVALTAQGRWHGRDVDGVARDYLAAHGSLDRLLKTFAEQDPDRDYALAGSFVSFLLDRDGIEPMVAFFAGCGPDQGRYQQALRIAYGRGLADLEYEWLRSLRAGGGQSARRWQDADGWPSSLQRRRVATAAPVPLASRAAGDAPRPVALERTERPANVPSD